MIAFNGALTEAPHIRSALTDRWPETVTAAREMSRGIGLEIADIDGQLARRKEREGDYVSPEYRQWRGRAMAARGHLERERTSLKVWIDEQIEQQWGVKVAAAVDDLLDEFWEHEPCEGLDCSACWAIYRAAQLTR